MRLNVGIGKDMRLKLHLFFSFLTISLLSQAQVADTLYFDADGFELEQEARAFAAWYEIREFANPAIKTGKVTRFEIERAIKSEYTWVNGLPHGPFTIYHRNGTVHVQGSYENGTELGLITEWYPNGQKKAEREIFKLSENNFLHTLNHAWTSNGDVMVKEGYGLFKRYHDNGQLAEYGNYQDGLKFGEWVFRNTGGKITHTLRYDSLGQVVDSTDDTNGERKDLSTEPQFPGGQAAWNRFLRRNLRYPKEASRASIQGMVKLTVKVNADGLISNIRITQSPAASLSNEAIRVIRLSPNWIPAKNNEGRPVSKVLPLQIAFRQH